MLFLNPMTTKGGIHPTGLLFMACLKFLIAEFMHISHINSQK